MVIFDMRKMKKLLTLTLIILIVPLALWSQEKSSFLKLIEETNQYLHNYSKLYPIGDQFVSIKDFGFSKKEIKEITQNTNRNHALSKNKDSIEVFELIYYFQEKISGHIHKIINHPDFLKHEIQKLITSDELHIAISDDKKLYNFSYDEKTGGSYREQVSIMYYTDYIPKDSSELADFESIFISDGYNQIHTLQTDEGTKYVLTGSIRGCSYCFFSFVQLISFKENKFIEEFMYSVESRDWNDGVAYNHETKTIVVDYHIDDLTPTCSCGDEVYNNDNSFYINCKSTYIFNGLIFELVEEGWKKVESLERD
jgi:hypothetical protein